MKMVRPTVTEFECEYALLTQAAFDGELNTAEAAAIERHRHSCRACQNAYRMLRQSRSLLAANATRHRAPARLRLLCAAGPAAYRATRRALWARSLASFGSGLAVAAGILLTVAPPRGDPLIEQVVSDHRYSLLPGHAIDVASTDQHVVKPWFDGKLDFAVPVRDLNSEGFHLEGGRLDFIDNRRVAALVYRSGTHTINLLIWPTNDESGSGPSFAPRNGYTVTHWVADGMTLWAVSDIGTEQLNTFMKLWVAAGLQT